MLQQAFVGSGGGEIKQQDDASFIDNSMSEKRVTAQFWLVILLIEDKTRRSKN
jgi:hypothetical protein